MYIHQFLPTPQHSAPVNSIPSAIGMTNVFSATASAFSLLHPRCFRSLFFFFNDPAPPEFYPFPLPDALPIYRAPTPRPAGAGTRGGAVDARRGQHGIVVPLSP